MDRRHCGCLLALAVLVWGVAQAQPGMSELVSAHMWQRLRLWHQARLPQFASAVRRLDGAVCKNAPSPEHHLCGEPKFRRFRTLCTRSATAWSLLGRCHVRAALVVILWLTRDPTRVVFVRPAQV